MRYPLTSTVQYFVGAAGLAVFASRLVVRLLSRVRDAGGVSVSSGPRIPSGCGCVVIDSPHAHGTMGVCCFPSAFAVAVFIWTVKMHFVSATTKSRSSVHTGLQKFFSSQTPFFPPNCKLAVCFHFLYPEPEVWLFKAAWGSESHKEPQYSGGKKSQLFSHLWQLGLTQKKMNKNKCAM